MNANKILFGLEWHPQIGKDLLDDLQNLDCLEIIAENFFYKDFDLLQEIGRSKVPTLIHSVELSLGSADRFRQEHFEKIRQVASQVNAVNFSDHLAWCKFGQTETLQPAILPFTKDAALAAAANIKAAQSQIDVPFLIENEANRYLFPHNEMSEPEFFNSVCAESGCSLLLDLTNLHTNAVNFGIDAKAWLDEVDLSKVKALHIAGGSYDDSGVLIDSHDAPVPEAVWELMRYIRESISPEYLILERNDRFPPYDLLKKELEIARSILQPNLSETSQDEVRV